MIPALLKSLEAGTLPTGDQTANAIRELPMTTESELIRRFLVALHQGFENSLLDHPDAVGLIIAKSAEALRSLAKPFPLINRPPLLLDTCGTGGDHQGTFNLSTTAALVVAGAGIPVAKHGNRAASSRCGSADILEACGLILDASPEQMAGCLEKHGIAFLFARTYHSAMAHVAAVRKTISHPTLFNLLGPLSNPAQPTHQFVGVYDDRLTRPVSLALKSMGIHSLVPFGGGMDEIAPDRPTSYFLHGRPSRTQLTPELFGFHSSNRSQIQGKTVAENREILLDLLQGKRNGNDPYRSAVLINAAVSLALCRRDPTESGDFSREELEEAVKDAAESLDSGQAFAKLRALVTASGGKLNV